MTIINTEHLPGHEIAELEGLIRCNTIRAKRFFTSLRPQRIHESWGGVSGKPGEVSSCDAGLLFGLTRDGRARRAAWMNSARSSKIS